jgi:hypothetical protein
VIGMQSVSTLIEFLMNLLRDEKTQAEFEHDPQATLAARGLDNVSGQDVRDAQLIMADDGAVHPKHGGGRSHHSRAEHDDPVREIRHTTQQYEASGHGDYHYTVGDVKQTFTFVNVDDRDTVVNDSFNSDDDGIDNKGGKISESVLAGDDIDGQVGVDNADDVDVLAINKSFNEDNSTDTDVDILTIEDSFNKTTDAQPAPGSPAPDATAPDATAPDADAPDATAPDATAPDATAPDATAPDATAPDATAPDATAPDATAPDATAPDAGAPVDVPVDHSLADEPPVDQPLVADPPAEEPIVDDLAPDTTVEDEPDLDPVHV